LNITVKNDPRISITLEGAKFIQITVHPDSSDFTKLSTLLETIDGQPGQMWKYEYGEDKSFTFDTVLSQEIASLLNTYRLAF